MISSKFLIALTIILALIQAGNATKETCLAKNDNLDSVSGTECQKETTSDTKCCYFTYVGGDFKKKVSCKPLTISEYNGLGNYIKTLQTENSEWSNFYFDCDHNALKTCELQNYYEDISKSTDCNLFYTTDDLDKSDMLCCFQSYTVSNTEKKECIPITRNQFTTINDYPKSSSVDKTWTNYEIQCGEAIDEYDECDSRNFYGVSDNMSCHSVFNSDGKCCYATYNDSGKEKKVCLKRDFDQLTTLEDYPNSVDQTWTDFKIDCDYSTAELCTNKNKASVISETFCNKISDSNTKCCYSSYFDEKEMYNRKCVPLGISDFSDLQGYTEKVNPKWTNYTIQCGQFFLKLSLLFLIIITFLF